MFFNLYISQSLLRMFRLCWVLCEVSPYNSCWRMRLCPFLDRDLSISEIEVAINSFLLNKTPGPDGLLGEWYKLYAKDLAQRICGVCTAMRLGPFPTPVLTHLLESALRVLVLLDVVKAFDSVDWVYMSSVLEVMGSGPGLYNWIKLMYKSPYCPDQIGMHIVGSVSYW